MKKLLIGIGVQLGSSAVAIVAALFLPGFSLGFGGFLTAVVVFTIAQSLLGWAGGKAGNQAYTGTGGSSLLGLNVAGTGHCQYSLRWHQDPWILDLDSGRPDCLGQLRHSVRCWCPSTC